VSGRARPAAGLLRLGTRGSPLALWQAEHVAAALAGSGVAVELVTVETVGDRFGTLPIERFGEPAIFSRELDDALRDGRVDLAVHSLKDLPAAPVPGVSLAAVGRRGDPRDALVTRAGEGLAALPPGATVATSSVRRRAQLLRVRPDLTVVPLRGNVDTRVRKLDDTPAWDAILLAVAGLARLGLDRRITERLAPEVMLPAPGQGAIAVAVRDDRPALAGQVRAAFDDPVTARCVAAERAFLRRVGGGCLLPVAALARVAGGRLALRGRILSVDGRDAAEGAVSASAPTPGAAARLGTALAERVLAAGGAELVARWSVEDPAGSPPVAG
jgi:hydroxymethylbilane synthase